MSSLHPFDPDWTIAAQLAARDREIKRLRAAVDKIWSVWSKGDDQALLTDMFAAALAPDPRPMKGSEVSEVIWIDSDTGEIKCRKFSGREPVIWSEHSPHNSTGKPWFDGEFDEWEMSALEMALGLVPDLETALDRARIQGRSVEVRVTLKAVAGDAVARAGLAPPSESPHV